MTEPRRLPHLGYFALLLFVASCCLGGGVYSGSAASQDIAIMGRYYFDPDQSSFLFDWSGVQLSFSVFGTSYVGLMLVDNGNEYNVFVNGQQQQDPLVTNSSTAPIAYTVIDALNPKSSYTIVIQKRTEALFGAVQLIQILVDEGASISAYSPQNPTRRIEVYGDSITCGYGDLGTPPCNFSASTEEVQVGYAVLTAQSFSAQYHIQAWSGKGVVRNYGSPNITSPDPLPWYFRLSVANDNTTQTQWNFSQYIPDVVIINLGSNDYSTQPSPPADVFEDAYVAFLHDIRGVYGPSVPLLLICGPLIGDPCCEYVAEVVQYCNNQLQDPLVFFVDMMDLFTEPTDYGCNGHPSVQGHQKMANVLIPAVQKVTGWQ